ncbi:MAG: hypothetical protein RLZZ254_141, partial [Actinomycetota bacterium]
MESFPTACSKESSLNGGGSFGTEIPNVNFMVR